MAKLRYQLFNFFCRLCKKTYELNQKLKQERKKSNYTTVWWSYNGRSACRITDLLVNWLTYVSYWKSGFWAANGSKIRLKIVAFFAVNQQFSALKYLFFALCYRKTAYLPANQSEESLSFISVANWSMKVGSAFLLFKPKEGVKIECGSNSIQTQKIW